jgi:hypothetical protein
MTVTRSVHVIGIAITVLHATTVRAHFVNFSTRPRVSPEALRGTDLRVLPVHALTLTDQPCASEGSMDMLQAVKHSSSINSEDMRG